MKVDRSLHVVDELPPCACGWRVAAPGHYCSRGSIIRVDGRDYCRLHYPLTYEREKRLIITRARLDAVMAAVNPQHDARLAEAVMSGQLMAFASLEAALSVPW